MYQFGIESTGCLRLLRVFYRFELYQFGIEIFLCFEPCTNSLCFELYQFGIEIADTFIFGSSNKTLNCTSLELKFGEGVRMRSSIIYFELYQFGIEILLRTHFFQLCLHFELYQFGIEIVSGTR